MTIVNTRVTSMEMLKKSMARMTKARLIMKLSKRWTRKMRRVVSRPIKRAEMSRHQLKMPPHPELTEIKQ